MGRQEAIERLLDHYQNPRNSGPLEPADVVMPGGNPGCGDLVTIYLRVAPGEAGDTVEAVSFEGRGCTISQAAASVLTGIAQGQPLDAIEAMDGGEMIDILGREVVQTRARCATLALNTLKAAVQRYRLDRRRESLVRGEHGDA